MSGGLYRSSSDDRDCEKNRNLGLNLDYTHAVQDGGVGVGGGGGFTFLEFVSVPLASSAACSRKRAMAFVKNRHRCNPADCKAYSSAKSAKKRY